LAERGVVEGVGHAHYPIECTRLKFLYVKREFIPANAGRLSFSINLHLGSYRHFLGALRAVLLGCQQPLHGLDLLPQFHLLDLQRNILVLEVERGHPYGKDGDGQWHKKGDKPPGGADSARTPLSVLAESRPLTYVSPCYEVFNAPQEHFLDALALRVVRRVCKAM
jgi:hypothetical protein